jgi:hypothetical protein
MGEPNEKRTIGSPWCPCGKHKNKEQVICFTCFCGLPMVVKYALCSLRLEVREKASAFSISRAVENSEPQPASAEGELFR